VRMTEMPLLKGSKGITSTTRKILKRANIAGSESLLAKGGEFIGGIIESEARAANFLIEFKDLGDFHRAARITQEIFVDYANLTEFENVGLFHFGRGSNRIQLIRSSLFFHNRADTQRFHV